MIYLKLFEGFVDDFQNNITTLSTKYNSDKEYLFKNFKEEVDQFMFDLTDEYSDVKDSCMWVTSTFDPNIYYFLKCKWVDFEKLIGILQEVTEKLESVNLKLMIIKCNTHTNVHTQTNAKELEEFYKVRTKNQKLKDSLMAAYVKFEVRVYI